MGDARKKIPLLYLGGFVLLGLFWVLKRRKTSITTNENNQYNVLPTHKEAKNARDEEKKAHPDGQAQLLHSKHPLSLGVEHHDHPTVFQDNLAPSLRSCSHKVSAWPEIVIPETVNVIHGLFSAEECECLIREATKGGFAPPPGFAADVRGCERRHTVDRGLSNYVMARLKPYLPEIVTIDGARWRLFRFTHHWRYVRYYEGGGFIPHWDGSKMLPDHEMSVFTVQVYLNDHFTGGSTRFYNDFKVTPLPSRDVGYGEAVLSMPPIREPHTHAVRAETGAVLIFDHAGKSMLHDGEVVKNGPKFILRGDLMYKALSEDVHILMKQECLTWCPGTAAKNGTRNAVGQVWICWCAVDGVGSCNHSTTAEELPEEPKREITQSKPLLTILISGKRFAGKDYVASLLQSALSKEGLKVHRAAIGDANKKLYSQKVGIDLERLKHDREFKEIHRIAMIHHHSERNKENPAWSEEMVWREAQELQADVLLVSDIRTLKGLEYFERAAGNVQVLRVHASEESRRRRGWVYDAIKDNLYTEVEMDGYLGWTACVDNSDDSETGSQNLAYWVNSTVLPRVLPVS
jgi:phosphomevalonate kinase